MARIYYYILVSAIRGEEKTYHLYITAKPRFSIRELLSKQINIIPAIVERFADIPLELHTAAQVEVKRLNLDLIPTVGNYIRLKMDRSSVHVCYDRFLEFSSPKRDIIFRLLGLLKEIWKGEWKESDDNP